MLPGNHPDRIQIAFDDHRLVANAGLLNNDNYFCRRVASSKLLPKRSYCLT